MSIVRVVKKVDEKILDSIHRLAESPKYSKIAVTVLIIVAIVLGVYIRTAPFGLNGFEFYEFDSYIEYWQAKYVYEKGLLAWYTLTPENQDTHIFWYPWGRDFTKTSYPFLPLWTGITYHIVGKMGFTLQEWSAIQPVFFAILAIIVAYFAVLEVTGSRLAGVIASILVAILPAAVERSVIGYVEKEGVSILFIFSYICFYAKGLKSINLGWRTWIKYTILAALFLAMVGWLWGGYVFLLGTVALYALLTPLIIKEHFKRDIVLLNILLVLLSMIFVIPSPANASSLGIYPLQLRGLGLILVGATILPLLYYYTGIAYKSIGLKKPVLTSFRYIILIMLILVIGVVLIVNGILPISGRLAWALGLRFVEVDPLVESIAEHQSPLSSVAAFNRMFQSWGSYYAPLVLFSPLFMSVLGSIYLLYKGTPEKAYIAIAFLTAFYSYLNAVYMVGAAAYFGVIVSSCMIALIANYAFPKLQTTIKKTKSKRARTAKTSIKQSTRIFALFVFMAIIANTALTSYIEAQLYTNVIYTFRAGVSGANFYTNSWYKVVEVLRNLPENSIIIAWWDYGYGISVPGERISIADGSTLNNTQIGIIGLILLSENTQQVIELAKLLEAKPDKTYLMVIEGLVIREQENEVAIWPMFTPGTTLIPGLVDWPKSYWMIRIGNSVVDQLRSKGINVSSIDTSKFLYLYNINQFTTLSPAFNKPETIPLIYKLVVDGILYWAEINNKTGKFNWYSGDRESLDINTRRYIQSIIKLDISTQIQVKTVESTSTRPLINDTILEPYIVVLEPFMDPKTLKPIITEQGTYYSIIVIYKLNIPEQSS